MHVQLCKGMVLLQLLQVKVQVQSSCRSTEGSKHLHWSFFALT